MKKKSILFLCLIGLTSFMSCSDKSSAEFEVSLHHSCRVQTKVVQNLKCLLRDNL